MTRLATALLVLVPAVVQGQWTNRYPKNQGFNHHVYLEGYELPILASGPGDPAPSPDDGTVIVASRGWLWRVDLATGAAVRITAGAHVDSRPAWSRDGRMLAFVRDDSRTTAIVIRDMTTGSEREIDKGMALDPVFTADGKSVVYANLEPGGDLDLWRFDLAGGQRVRLTMEAGLELRPQLALDGTRLLYLSKTRAGGDQVRLRSLGDGRETVLLSANIVSQARPALSPDGTLLAYNWPGTFGWELRLLSTDRPGASTLLVARPRGRPLTPAWSADGQWVYYSEADAQQRLHLWRIRAYGGAPEQVSIRSWDYGVPTGRLSIRTNGPARLSVHDAVGHPLVPAAGMVRFDGQNGLTYFYSSGSVEIEAPVGAVHVRAVRGLTTPAVATTATVSAGNLTEATLSLRSLWEARQNGWYSGDHHFHLNYGGPMDLALGDLVAPMLGEDLDAGTPMLANLHNRFENQDQWAHRSAGSAPYIAFAQEVRSHFLGHVGLVGTSELVWPWVWGPAYEVYGRDDRPNAEALAEGRKQGGVGIYVHPVFGPTPFTDQGLSQIPVELVADAVHDAFDLLEVVCLWSNAIGTAEVWYRLLNAGYRIMPSGGTDAMTDLHRTMAVGSTRVYARLDGPFSWGSYLAALRAGRSFVTTGPMVDFTAGGARPGEVVARANADVTFTLGVHSAVPVDSIAVVVNGRAMWSAAPDPAPFSRTYSGTVRLPAGGWIAARVVGPAVDQWPAMASRTFAHSAPVWISTPGSTEPAARRAAATDLLRALTNAEQRLDAGYAGTPIPRLKAHFASAREKLTALAR
ncbi:MAG: CehA/McbA family metallohydrolase [Gemmatimonadaceae bacterium]